VCGFIRCVIAVRSDEAVHSLLCCAMDCFAGARKDGRCYGCLKFESEAYPNVVPAKAGTYDHRGSCGAKSSNGLP
jgi:hypothetical protein